MARHIKRDLSASDYRSLAEFRYELRKFLRFSEEASRAADLEAGQHQFLLALKGMPEGIEPTAGHLAERLQIKHNSLAGLIDRLEANGLVKRSRATKDHRRILVGLTTQGERVLRDLSRHHRDELQAAAPALIAALLSIVGQPGDASL